MTESTYEVSCIVPTFNDLGLASRAILSAVNQVNANVEVIICDDSPSNEIQDFVERLAKWNRNVRYVEGPKTGNAVDNWNCGLSHGNAEFAVVLHHDEFFIDPLYIRKSIDAAKRCGAEAVFSKTTVVSLAGSSQFRYFQAMTTLLVRYPGTLLSLNWIGPTGSVIFRRHPDRYFDANLLALVDVEFYLKLIKSTRVIFALKTVSVVSIFGHKDQISLRGDIREIGRRERRRLVSENRFRLTALERRVLFSIEFLRGC